MNQATHNDPAKNKGKQNKGEPTGTAAADSARVILQLAERVANFR